MLKSFNQLKKEAIESKNKIGFLVDVFRSLHNDALPEEFDNIGGRMAGIVNQAGKDYIIVLQTIWKSSSDGIVGSHLNFIQAMVKNRIGNGYKTQTTRYDKPMSDKLITKRLSAYELMEKERQENNSK